jgi:DNA-binding MurR/RpiR family transcriptional regulator
MGELTKPFYKFRELAELASVSKSTIRRRIKHLKIKTKRDGKRIVRVPLTEARRLMAWLEK